MENHRRKRSKSKAFPQTELGKTAKKINAEWERGIHVLGILTWNQRQGFSRSSEKMIWRRNPESGADWPENGRSTRQLAGNLRSVHISGEIVADVRQRRPWKADGVGSPWNLRMKRFWRGQKIVKFHSIICLIYTYIDISYCITYLIWCDRSYGGWSTHDQFTPSHYSHRLSWA